MNVNIVNGYGINPCPGGNSGLPGESGVVMYDRNISAYKVVSASGASHTIYPPSYTVGMTKEAQDVIEWAKKKMKEDYEFDMMCLEHPQLDDLKQQLEVMKALVRKHENTSV